MEVGESAMLCTACGTKYFPTVSPAIIVSVIRDDKILLARAHRFPPGMYSVIAGFVEPGENLEQCVRREVMEETGIEIRDIRYFGSQPWPFPNSLMIAFTSRYAGGRIVIGEDEISDAGWFGREDLPVIPPPVSIARRLIDWFIGGREDTGV
jgi:NAD+ diphosphatase